jgi:ribosomal protein S18 acetylase RimI-like enzyme
LFLPALSIQALCVTPYHYRFEPVPQDIDAVRKIVESTRFFSPAEVDIACELVATRLDRGRESGYEFVFLDDPHSDNLTIGYACFGEIPCTIRNYDLYWIAVDDAFRGRGLGRNVLLTAEAHIRKLCGRQIYVDTAGRDQYEPTRRFYERNGYTCVAVLKDFYAPGDAKHIYSKDLEG